MPHKRNTKRPLLLLFLLYLLLLLFVVLLKGGTVSLAMLRFDLQSIKEYGAEAVNLIPFRTIAPYLRRFDLDFAFQNIVGNIAAFVPLGFFFSLLCCKKRLLGTMLCSLLVILGIETAQLLFQIGIFDVDDILLNGIGALLGWCVSRLWFFRA